MARSIRGCWRYIRRKMTSRLMFLGVLALMVVGIISRSRIYTIDPFEHTKALGPSATNLNGLEPRAVIVPTTASKKNTSATYYNVAELRHEHEARAKHVYDQCQGQEDMLLGLSTDNWAYGRIEIGRQHHYLYCPLLKVGSTFFRRVFYTMRAGDKLTNPYKVPINKALSAKRNVLSELMPMNSASTVAFLNNSTSIMFVREPFSRLLSGYVDKIFAPNPYFWSEIGKHVIANFRDEATTKSLKCGHDVTFDEFVRYVIHGEVTNSSKRDAHFTPTYDQCKPCQLNYTVIGKMESFKQDVAFTLAELGHNISKESLSDWARDATYDAIMDSTVSPFGWRNGVRKCMTWHEGLRRIWRKMQIRGIILLEHKFPWSREYSETHVTVRKFMDAVKNFHDQADKEKLNRQKKEVLAEAFSRVKPSDLSKLVDIFKPDFELFEYDPHPDFIFDENYVKQFRDRDIIFNLDNV